METGFGYIKSQTELFALTVHRLKSAIAHIKTSDRITIQPAIAALKSCRIQYKKISFFLDYFYPQQSKLFNAPAKKEVEEPYMEYEESQSFQQIESILFSPDPFLKKAELENLVLVLDESAAGLASVYAGFQATETQMMEALRLEMIRIMTLYITGYDAPDLKTGIIESRAALQTMSYLADLFFNSPQTGTAKLDSLWSQAIQYTYRADFDHFNRLIFLTAYTLPLEQELERNIQTNGWELSTVSTLHYTRSNLFRGELNDLRIKNSDSLTEVGRALFFDKNLSGNKTRSCASCHQPDRYFTDGLIANQKINSDQPLRRNTPTLLYAACQQTQFWDGRAASLSEQIGEVLTSPDEMNASVPEIVNRISKSEFYRGVFHDSVNLEKIESALSSYLHTMQPMNSAFDVYMAGDEGAMTVQQKKGFNVFMGKALCATCHFAPLFNGSIPPFFNRSEYEVLGAPGLRRSGTFSPDSDLGRYERYPDSVYLRAFKTPTVRNVSKTAPYMHNGCFKTLNEVMDFYNKGGGAGIGLGRPEQTLSAKRLHLSHEEITDIIAFLDALTDKLPAASH